MPIPFRNQLLLFISIFLLNNFAHAIESPNQNWQTMHLPHFDLIYDAEHQELANIYATGLERAYVLLSPLFTEQPAKTTVILQDVTDATNGSAAAFPYPLIIVYPVLPGPNETISEYAEWANELVLHEYTHILAQTQKRGAFAGLYRVFGSLMNPNMFLPRWWHEGLAVETETRFSNHGRLRARSQDAALRSYVLANQLQEVGLPQANEVNIPEWPYGARPYLFGSLFWSELLAEKGTTAIKDLSWAHAGHMPFFLNAPGESVFGASYPEEFAKILSQVEQRVKNQLTQMQQTPAPKSIPLVFTDLESFSPVLSPDGLKMAFIGKDASTRRAVRLMIRPSTKTPFSPNHLQNLFTGRQGETTTEMRSPVPLDHEDGPPTGTISRLNWFPDSKKLVYDRLDTLNRFRTTSDLYTYDLGARKSERLTTGLRAREPAVAPSGQQLVYVQVIPGRTNLATFDLNSKASTVIFESEMGARCSSPVYLTATKVAFTYRNHGVEQMQVLDLNTHEHHQVLSDHRDIHFLHYANKQLSFVSSKNGVPNLYVAAKDFSQARPATFTMTAIGESEWDPYQHEFYLSELSDQGMQLRRLPSSEAKRIPRELPIVKPLYADRYPAQTEPEGASVSLSKTDLQPEAYSPWSYLLPRYWIPFFYWDAYSSYLSISTGASDPTNHHEWGLSASYDIMYGRLDYSFTYSNNSFSPMLQALLYDFTYQLPGANSQRTQLYHGEADFEITAISPFLYLTAGWTAMNRTLSGYSTSQAGPSVGFNYLGYTQAGAQISPESGWGTTGLATSYLANGSQLSYNQYEGSLVGYWSRWLPKRHVLMTKLQGFYQDKGVPSSNWIGTVSLSQYANTMYPQYLMRGYQTGTFQSRDGVLGNFEYRFPLFTANKGWGTLPLFLRRWHGAIILDGLAADGVGFNTNTNYYNYINSGHQFWNLGGELHLDTTAGYNIPLTIYAGIYAPLDLSLGGSPNIALGLLL